MNSVIENILTRRSVRKFLDKQIPREDLELILKAGSYAPTAMGMQSWRFTAIQNAATLRKVNESIRQAILSIPEVDKDHPYGKRYLEKAMEERAEFLFNAPAYIIVSNLRDNPNSRADCALAIGNMMLAAHSLGIGSCWLNQLPNITHLPIIRALLNELEIPDDHDVFGSFVLGYPAETPAAAPRKDVIRIIS